MTFRDWLAASALLDAMADEIARLQRVYDVPPEIFNDLVAMLRNLEEVINQYEK